MNNLAESCNLYIPTMDYIYKILSCGEFTHRKPKKTSNVNFDFWINIKISKSFSGSSYFWNSLFIKLNDVLVQTLSIYSKKIFFPEICYNLIYFLRRIRKNFKFNFYKTKLSLLIQLIERQIVSIETKKQNFKFCPKNVKNCQNFEKTCAISLDEINNERKRIDEENHKLIKQKIFSEKEEKTYENNEDDEEVSQSELSLINESQEENEDNFDDVDDEEY